MTKLKVDEIEALSTNQDLEVITKGSTGSLEIKGNSVNEGTLQLNCSAQSHGVKLKAPSNSSDLGYTMTLPDNQIATSKIFKVKSVTNNNAQLEYADVPPNDLTSTPLDASNITSGTIASTRIPDFPASTGLGLKLISAQEVTSSNVNNVQFTGLEDNTAYHLVFKSVEADANVNYEHFYAYLLDANNNDLGGRVTGINFRHDYYVNGYREFGSGSSVVLAPNYNYTRFGAGPFSGHMDFYTGNSNSVQINGTTSYGMWGNVNSWTHSVSVSGYMESSEHWFTFSGSYKTTPLKGIRLGYDSSSVYIRPNGGAKFLLYKYQET
tara:strand:+ start:1906 stop:2874 length:969 start_codon:yes stop_codon:yes gene_type:complete